MMRTLLWTEKDVPDGSVIGVLSDIHIPHHDDPAVRIAIEVLEDNGCTHAIGNGDIADCGPASRHERKKRKAAMDEGCLLESVAPGLWIYEWLRSKRAILTLGNHEAWVEDYIDETPEVRGQSVCQLLGLPGDGNGWDVLPSKSRIRLGNRVWEHGDGIFPSGTGGQNPAARIRTLAPDQTTSVGHLHRMFANFWSSVDEHGNQRTRGAFGNGHLSVLSAHEKYAGTYLNWQQSFEITRVYWLDGRPRFSTHQVEIHRDKRGRPFAEYNGKVYR